MTVPAPPAPAVLRAVVAASPPVVHPAEPRHRCGTGTHSTLADGRRVCWSPPPVEGVTFVVDAERADQVVPPALAGRLHAADPLAFWRDWTRAEVFAKATDVPILQWVTEQRWPPPDRLAWGGDEVVVVTLGPDGPDGPDHPDGLVVSFGLRRAAAR